MEACVWGLRYVALLESLCSEMLLASWPLNIHVLSVIFLLPKKCVCKWCPMTPQNPVQLHSECSCVLRVDKHLASHLNISCSNVVLHVIPAVILLCHLGSIFLKELCFSEWTSIPFLHLQLETKKVQANSTCPAWKHEGWHWGRAQDREGRWRTARVVWRGMIFFKIKLQMMPTGVNYNKRWVTRQ